MRTRLEELDRVAFDLANISTAGYKSERIAKRWDREQFGNALDSAVDVALADTKVDFRPGTITTTGRDLDVAIDGRGFFAVETEAGVRYTRNGSFQRNSEGILTTSDGLPVHGEDGGEIALGTGPVSVSPDGTVKTGATVVGRLRVVEFGSERDLIRESGTRFRALTGASAEDVEPKVLGGALEQSNVSIVDRMAALTEVSRGFEALQKGVSVLLNELDGRAISELVRR
jgi:flagellar basal body rod protein FlgG